MRYQDLKKDVIDKSKCCFCGGCQIACPAEVIEINKEPELVGNCIDCGKCYDVCPATPSDLEELEIKNYFSAKSKVDSINERSQDGGVVSTILKNLFENDEINAAVAADNKNWKPIPSIITEKEEITQIAGTKYGLVPLLKMVEEASEKGKIALVGTPCHIKAGRFLKEENIGKIKYLISIFCMQNFDYKCLIKDELSNRGLKEDKIDRIGINSGKLIVKTDESKQKIELSEIEKCAIEACEHCKDFDGKYSDISIGSIDSEKGYSTVLIRTKEGEKIAQLISQDLEIKEIKDLNGVKKLDKIK